MNKINFEWTLIDFKWSMSPLRFWNQRQYIVDKSKFEPNDKKARFRTHGEYLVMQSLSKRKPKSLSRIWNIIWQYFRICTIFCQNLKRYSARFHSYITEHVFVRLNTSSDSLFLWWTAKYGTLTPIWCFPQCTNGVGKTQYCLLIVKVKRLKS